MTKKNELSFDFQNNNEHLAKSVGTHLVPTDLGLSHIIHKVDFRLNNN